MASAREMRLAPLWEPRPQEWVQRHAVDQLADDAPRVPTLDFPMPLLVDKLEDVLKIVDLFVPEQGAGDRSAQDLKPFLSLLLVGFFLRRRRRNSWVDEPVPDAILAHGRCDLGVKWCQIATRGGRCYWWVAGTRHVQWRRPEGFTASPGRYISTGQG